MDVSFKKIQNLHFGSIYIGDMSGMGKNNPLTSREA